ncbi:MAG TPA: phosphotransferase [Candidatus Limnocylindrales bacterium]|nr:phosphotransferase [Candidatus Limnocylindrales bacterium]
MTSDYPPLVEVLAEHGLSGVEEAEFPNDGWSGARLTRLVRGDGARFVIKRDGLALDWIARVTGDVPQLREALLANARPALPWPVRLPHLAVARDGELVAELMPDLTGTLLRWEHPVANEAVDAVLAALAALHREPWHEQVPNPFPWTDLTTRVTLLTRSTAERYHAAGLPVGARFLSGWDAFDRLVRPPVRDLLRRLSDDPAPLMAALGRLPNVGLHGDLKLGNVGIGEDGTAWMIDWQMTMVAPVAVELGWFLVCNVASLRMPPEQALERYRVAAGLADDDAWRETWDLAVLVGLVLRGWRKGLDTEAGVVYPSGKAAAYDLAWWGSQAIGAAERRL